MIGNAIYKLLDIDPNVNFLTHYHLLGIDPKEFTMDEVDAALVERRKLLRDRCPGPQFIPIIIAIEQQLDQAAKVLKDHEAHLAYRRELVEQVKHRTALKRREVVQKAREIIQSYMTQEGILQSEHHALVVGELRDIGIPDKDIQFLLSQIPQISPSSIPSLAPPPLSYPTEADHQQQNTPDPADQNQDMGKRSNAPQSALTNQEPDLLPLLDDAVNDSQPPAQAESSQTHEQPDHDAYKPVQTPDQVHTPDIEALASDNMRFVLLAMEQKLEDGPLKESDIEHLVDLAKRVGLDEQMARQTIHAALQERGMGIAGTVLEQSVSETTPSNNHSVDDQAPGFLQSKADQAHESNPEITKPHSSFASGYIAGGSSTPSAGDASTPLNIGAPPLGNAEGIQSQSQQDNPLHLVDESTQDKHASPASPHTAQTGLTTTSTQGPRTSPVPINYTMNQMPDSLDTPVTEEPLGHPSPNQQAPVIQNHGMNQQQIATATANSNRVHAMNQVSTQMLPAAQRQKTRRYDMLIGLCVVLVGVCMIVVLSVWVLINMSIASPEIDENQPPVVVNPTQPGPIVNNNSPSVTNPPAITNTPVNDANQQAGAELAYRMMLDLDDEKLRQLLSGKQRPILVAAMPNLTRHLLSDDMITRGKSEKVFNLMLDYDPSTEAPQLAVNALADAIMNATNAEIALTPANLLSTRLRLKRLQLTDLQSQTQRLDMANILRHDFKRSSQSHPLNPMHDPSRLSLAILKQGGSLAFYAGMANIKQFENLLTIIVGLAQNPGNRAQATAIQAMVDFIQLTDNQVMHVVPLTQLALSHVMLSTTNASDANIIRTALLNSLNTGENNKLRALDLSTRAARVTLSDTIKIHILKSNKPLYSSRYAQTSTLVLARDDETSAARIQMAFSQSNRAIEHLTDIALLSLAQYERIARLRGGSTVNQTRLKAAINPKHTEKQLISFPKLIDDILFNTPQSVVLSDEDYKKLQADIISQNQREAYLAISRLHADGSNRAAKVLGEALNQIVIESVKDHTYGIVARILIALRTINDQNVPRYLLQAYTQASDEFIEHAIIDHLILGTNGPQTALNYTSSSRPALRHNKITKRAAMSYWAKQMDSLVWQAAPASSFLNYEPGVNQSKQTRTKNREQQSVTERKLLVTIIGYHADANTALKTFKWDDREWGKNTLPHPIGHLETMPQAEKLIEETRKLTYRLDRLIREHPRLQQMNAAGDTKLVTQADLLMEYLKTERLLTDNTFQRYLVETEAQGHLLAILARLAAGEVSIEKELNEIQAMRENKLKQSQTALLQCRSSMYANLMLWDLINEHGGGS